MNKGFEESETIMFCLKIVELQLRSRGSKYGFVSGTLIFLSQGLGLVSSLAEGTEIEVFHGYEFHDKPIQKLTARWLKRWLATSWPHACAVV